MLYKMHRFRSKEAKRKEQMGAVTTGLDDIRLW